MSVMSFQLLAEVRQLYPRFTEHCPCGGWGEGRQLSAIEEKGY